MSEGNSRVSAAYVDAAISRLESQVDQQIHQLELEMQNLASQVVAAIDHQTRQLSGDLDRQTAAIVAQAVLTYKLLGSAREQLVDELSSTRVQLTKDFKATRENLSLKTEADLQLDLAEKIAGAVSTRDKINRFVADITSRFDKSVEGIFLNRQLYNHNFKKIFDEYQHKIRTIAQHIYEIGEQDFGPATQAALTPPEQICDLPVEVDLLRLKCRAESLDECLELLKTARLDDILLSVNKLAGQLENDFSVKLTDPAAGPVFCAHGLLVRVGSRQTLLLQSSVNVRRDGPAERVEIAPPTDDFARYQQGGARRALEATLARRRERPATSEEKDALRATAQRLAGRGVITQESQALLNEFLGTELLHQLE